MEQITPTEQNTSDSKPVERSAAYPAKTIEDCLLIVKGIYANFKTAFTKRSDIIDIVEEVNHPRDLAAATYYTLLNRVKDTYQVSEELFMPIEYHLEDNEREDALLIAFKAPKLYKELIDKFNGSQLPKELVVHLHRFHHITEDAAPLAAEVFIKNAKFCKVLDENNNFNIDSPLKTKSPEIKDEKPNGEELNKGIHPPSPNGQANTNPQEVKGLLEEMVDSETSKIRLTGNRFATFKYPVKLSQKDIEILKKHIEMLELLVE
jgi:hypothetical protein